MVERLRQIYTDLEGPSEDARYMAWFQLYSEEGKAGRQELEHIIAGHNAILKILLARFLGQIEAEQAVQYIICLLGDLNPSVCEAAQHAFEKNQLRYKIELLYPLLASKQRLAQAFAIETMALASLDKIRPSLYTLLEIADEELLHVLLSALRHLPHRDNLPILKPFLEANNEETRFRALTALGSLYRLQILESPDFFLKATADSSARVRRAAVWILKQKLSPLVVGRLKKLSRDDDDPHVRVEALCGLVLRPDDESIVLHILERLAYDNSTLVTLKGEGLLLSLSSQVIERGLRQAMRSSDLKIRDKALLTLAERSRGASGQYAAELIRALQEETDPKRQLAFLEALGICGDPQAIPILEGYLVGPPVLAYAAMGALLKLLTVDHIDIITRLLGRQALGALLKQSLLRHLRIHIAPTHYSDPLRKQLQDFIYDDNLNIRYLATQLLALSGDLKMAEPLFEHLLTEKDPVNQNLIQESLAEIFQESPPLLVQLMEQHRASPAAIFKLFSYVSNVALQGSHALYLIQAIIGTPLHLVQTVHSARVIMLLARLIQMKKVCLAEAIRGLVDPKDEVHLLHGLAAAFRKKYSQGLDIPFSSLQPFWEEGEAAVQGAVMELLVFTDSRQAVPILTDILCHPRHKAWQPRAATLLREIAGFST